MNKSRASKRKVAFLKKKKAKAKASKRPAPSKPKAKPKAKPKRQEAPVAEVVKTEEVKPKSFTYNPHPGDPEETVAFGKPVKKGQAVEFTDPIAIRKLENNPSFWDDARRKKHNEEVAKVAIDAAARERAVTAEQEMIEALHTEEQEIDTHLPEVPQAESIAQQKQRKLVQELKRISDIPPPPEADAASRRKKAE